MDSVTQIGLIAAVGDAVLGSYVGRRALLWGGICGLMSCVFFFLSSLFLPIHLSDHLIGKSCHGVMVYGIWLLLLFFRQ